MRRPCRTFGSRFATSCCGIGGFRSGLEKAEGYECVGFCEIDKNAETAYRAMYDTEKEVFYNDITKINAEEISEKYFLSNASLLKILNGSSTVRRVQECTPQTAQP